MRRDLAGEGRGPARRRRRRRAVRVGDVDDTGDAVMNGPVDAGLALMLLGLGAIAWQAVVAAWDAAAARRRRLRAALRAEAELQAAEDQAMRIANGTSWREFVREHQLEPCGPTPCDAEDGWICPRHRTDKEQAQ